MSDVASVVATRVSDLVNATFDRDVAPGFVVSVVCDGEIIFSGGYGVLSVESEVIPTADSQFRIASMSKSFTAAAIMRLRDGGELRLDDPVAKYVPLVSNWRYPTTDAPQITVQDLLAMRAGLGTDDPWADRQLDIGRSDFDSLLSAGGSFAHNPRAAYHYSNYGYALLGEIIHQVTGNAAQTYITQNILEPLGMDRTTWLPLVGEQHAVGHVRRALINRELDGSDTGISLDSVGRKRGNSSLVVCLDTDRTCGGSQPRLSFGASQLGAKLHVTRSHASC